MQNEVDFNRARTANSEQAPHRRCFLLRGAKHGRYARRPTQPDGSDGTRKKKELVEALPCTANPHDKYTFSREGPRNGTELRKNIRTSMSVMQSINRGGGQQVY